MMDKTGSINSTNEQFETAADQSAHKVSKKLERKPLIGGGGGGASSGGLSLADSAVGSSAGLSTAEQGAVQPNGLHHNGGGVPGSLADGSGGSPAAPAARTLRTSDGVFAPVALSQFSSLLFLRVGYLVGNGGLFASMGLLTVAYSILIFTVLSICAISTNGAVEGGGAYYMISRTLGPEMGGAIGLVFYVANVFSCALYASGCVEGVLQGLNIALFPDPENGTFGNETHSLHLNHGEVYLISVGVLLVLLCLCLIGANMFAKCTNLFFYSVCIITGVVMVAMLAQKNIVVPYARTNNHNTTNHSGLFTGPSLATMRGNLYGKYTVDYTNELNTSFISLFGVLFSGVTGIMAGANMSGELKDPGYSIPRGTLWACAFTFFVYLCLFVATAGTTASDVLVNNYVFMGYICYWKPLVYIGIVLATVCAGLSNMIGASRILRAIAADKVLGSTLNVLLRVNKCGCLRCCSCMASNDFLGPLLFTFLASAAVLGMGDMNSIAPYTSVFFLLSYATVNVACMMLIWAGAPNFRPKFQAFNIWTCGIGALSTLAVMLTLNTMAALACIALFLGLLGILYFYHLKHPSSEYQWGSVGQAVLFHTVRKYLLKLDFRREHVKFWRPHLLLLVANPRGACPLVDTLNDLKKSGIYILGHVRVNKEEPRDLSEEYNKWQEYVDHLRVKAFVTLTESRSVRDGALQIVRASGLGALRPNTVVLGFRDDIAPQDFLSQETCGYFMRPGVNSITPSWQNLDRQNPGILEEQVADVVLPTLKPGSGAGFSPPLSSPTAGDASAPRRQERISAEDYVGLLSDILSVGKSFVLCRNFHKLDKESIARTAGEKRFIDVWPINFLCPDNSTVDDTTSLFTLQLGTILNMVKFWRKNTVFRVFLIVPREWSEDFTLEQKKKVKDTLASVRMNAVINTVSFGSQQDEQQQTDALPQESVEAADRPAGAGDGTDHPLEGAAASPFDDVAARQAPRGGNSLVQQLMPGAGRGGRLASTTSTDGGSDDTGLQLERLTGRYLSSVNHLIRRDGAQAAVTFLNVPRPPADTRDYPMYLDALSRLSHSIDSCIMVHGISRVTTTTL